MADDRESYDGGDPNDDENRRPEDGDRYVPTPEEIESGDAPRASERSPQEKAPEESSGFFKRFKMRRRKGVGKKRRYVSPETQVDAGGGEDDEPPDSSGVVAALGDGPPDRDAGGAEAEVPTVADSQTDSDIEERGLDESEQTIEVGEGKQEHETDESEDEDSESDRLPAPARRVESVAIDGRRERKPEPEPERRLSLEESCIERLFRVAEEHGHSMGELERDLGSDNSTARCVECGLRATLVASRDDMSTNVRWDSRGPALERQCKS